MFLVQFELHGTTLDEPGQGRAGGLFPLIVPSLLSEQQEVGESMNKHIFFLKKTIYLLNKETFVKLHIKDSH